MIESTDPFSRRGPASREKICDSVFESLDEESKELDKQEAEIRRTKRGEALEVLLDSLADQRREIAESRKTLQRHR
jgi:hypothetical protein